MNRTELCPRFEQAVSLLSRRWNALIIYSLLDGPSRFCEVTETIGISNRLLSERLKELETDGIVSRTVSGDSPVRIQYSLTEKGMALLPVLQELESWATKWVDPAPEPAE
ncbi:winged helix-turn-helix transcriptional regulator [Edaphobacillus lindanitolerans]|uniref:Transcriptional regulator, HxlR family n=1 Tax=Edaphobacillus lindanitolerans TaxID=550447 RepID=A0A1U7PLM9_9BACI|nr:helix-turn-helix domain-containing protein [Edaphobacillus lindanitolerans]SIT75962.1 transcriptional regulator, HxlR family [Edaphobacillus lindanitolerans]